MSLRHIHFPLKDSGLRDDVGMLGALVGEVVEEQVGDLLDGGQPAVPVGAKFDRLVVGLPIVSGAVIPGGLAQVVDAVSRMVQDCMVTASR